MTAGALKRRLLVLPGVGVSLLPKLMCPACWPAYAALLSSVGLGFLISTAYLLPLTVLFLAVAVGAMGFRTSRSGWLWPFGVGVVAAVVILVGKFSLESVLASYLGCGPVGGRLSVEYVAATGHRQLLSRLPSGRRRRTRIGKQERTKIQRWL
jgi:hypothetical protein